MTTTDNIRRREAYKFLCKNGSIKTVHTHLDWLMAAENEEDYKDREWCVGQSIGEQLTPQEVYEDMKSERPSFVRLQLLRESSI